MWIISKGTSLSSVVASKILKCNFVVLTGVGCILKDYIERVIILLMRIKGGIGVKHFAKTNQEKSRKSVDLISLGVEQRNFRLESSNKKEI